MRFDPDTARTIQLTHLPSRFEGVFGFTSSDGGVVAYDLQFNEQHVGVRVVDGDGRNDRPLLDADRRDVVARDCEPVIRS